MNIQKQSKQSLEKNKIKTEQEFAKLRQNESPNIAFNTEWFINTTQKHIPEDIKQPPRRATFPK